MVDMVVRKENGGYRFYSWESEILKQIGNQEKLTLVGSALEGTYLDLKYSLCMALICLFEFNITSAGHYNKC